MNKYQIVVLRSLKGFGQFVTESRDETNTLEFGAGDERPIIFGEKLKAVERRTVMRKVREVLGVKCWLTTSKKGADSGISGLCMSCPACALFGGTYAPKKKSPAGESKNVIEMRRVYYTAAFPFVGGGIRDVTFNAVDERTGQTGTALNTNQVIEPRDFIDVVTVEAHDLNWVKLVVWGIEHTDRYGANTRIYGEIHNSVLAIIEDTRLRVAAIDLARRKSGEDVKAFIENGFAEVAESKGNNSELGSQVTTSTEGSQKENKERVKTIELGTFTVEHCIKSLTTSAEVEDLARRKNQVDIGVDEYFNKVKTLSPTKDEKNGSKEAVPTELPAPEPSKKESQRRDRQPTVTEKIATLKKALQIKSHYDLARKVESVIWTDISDEDDAE